MFWFKKPQVELVISNKQSTATYTDEKGNKTIFEAKADGDIACASCDLNKKGYCDRHWGKGRCTSGYRSIWIFQHGKGVIMNKFIKVLNSIPLLPLMGVLTIFFTVYVILLCFNQGLGAILNLYFKVICFFGKLLDEAFNDIWNKEE